MTVSPDVKDRGQGHLEEFTNITDVGSLLCVHHDMFDSLLGKEVVLWCQPFCVQLQCARSRDLFSTCYRRSRYVEGTLLKDHLVREILGRWGP